MKKFLTIDEQLSLLANDRNLEINDYERFEYYIKSYNFQNIIKRYDRFFTTKINGQYQYNDGICSEDIIDLFNFDRAISHMILPNILNIERRLSTAICYVICEKFSQPDKNNYIKELENGLLMNISNKDFSFIFPKVDFDEINAFKYEIVKHTLKNNKIKNEYNITDDWNVRNIPIWELAINWTFDTIVEILTHIRKELKTNIIKYYFQKNKLNNEILDNFIALVKMLNTIKNRTYHNNQIFDIEIKMDRNNINAVLNHLDLRDPIYKNSTSIRLYEILEIIDYLWQRDGQSLCLLISNMLKQCIKHQKNRKDTWKPLLSFMKFYQFTK